LRRFLEHITDDRLTAAWQLAAMTGMRRGEVPGLCWRNVDFDKSRVTVCRSLISSDYQITVSEPKTERGRRVVAIDSTLVDGLREHQGGSYSNARQW
jgi:integrase